MDRIEQVTSVSSSALDAAVQDERMTELERQINTLYAEIAKNAAVIGRLAKRIERLETEAALSKEQRLQVVANTAVINRIHSRIAKRLAKPEKAQRQSEA